MKKDGKCLVRVRTDTLIEPAKVEDYIAAKKNTYEKHGAQFGIAHAEVTDHQGQTRNLTN